MEIIQADSSYKGLEIVFHYTSDYYYAIQQSDWKVEFIRTPFKKTMHKTFTDELLSDWLTEGELYVMMEDGKMLGFIELSKETWNHRLRISNIWVDESYRHQGIGSSLMEKANERAKELGVRMIVLETQTCNDHAISFYLKHGFKLIGYDAYSYSNEDISRNEVRIEMGKCCICKDRNVQV